MQRQLLGIENTLKAMSGEYRGLTDVELMRRNIRKRNLFGLIASTGG